MGRPRRRPVGKANGLVFWRGPSQLDGEPVVAIATGFRPRYDSNEKTGNVISTFILREDVSPEGALGEGKDFSVCGDCKLRPMVLMGDTYAKRACYVHIGQVGNVWRAYKLGRYAEVHELLHDWTDELATRVVRFGSYGDPAALPTWVWEELAARSRAWVGYTHQWRSCDPALRALVMASVDTPEEFEDARDLGWRTFRTRLDSEPLEPLEIACPGAIEMGKRTTCEKCRLCDGARDFDRRRQIAIVAHGSSASTYPIVRDRLRVLR